MSTKNVNLDALIPRADFLVEDGPAQGESEKKTATTTDLKKGESFYGSLRKPDFQRETAAWKPEHILALVRAFLDGDLIPAVVCWQSPSRLSFVIDGAHRLSAIMAWILDDYGDGEETIKFYNNQIPEKQRTLASRTRRLMNKEIGSYKDVMAEVENPNSNPELKEYARALPHCGVQLQWLKKAESEKAEQAFFTINQSAVKIDNTELKILNTRYKPNAIVARAIIQKASGHRYWDMFSPEAVAELEELAVDINGLLFQPPLKSPIRTIDLPLGGHGYGSQSLPLIYDLVNLANGIPVEDASKYKVLDVKREVPKEATTLNIMKNTLKLVRRMTSTHSSSLGLHPAVYFYSDNGRYLPTAVMAMSAMFVDLERRDDFPRFCDNRSVFEEFLLTHKDFVNQISRRARAMWKAFRVLREYFDFLISCIEDGCVEPTDLESSLLESDQFSFLKRTNAIASAKTGPFSKETKQRAFLEEALSVATLCSICGARKDNKSIQADHRVDLKYGGSDDVDNLQFVHPYCNSTYKDIKN